MVWKCDSCGSYSDGRRCDVCGRRAGPGQDPLSPEDDFATGLGKLLPVEPVSDYENRKVPERPPRRETKAGRPSFLRRAALAASGVSAMDRFLERMLEEAEARVSQGEEGMSVTFNQSDIGVRNTFDQAVEYFADGLDAAGHTLVRVDGSGWDRMRLLHVLFGGQRTESHSDDHWTFNPQGPEDAGRAAEACYRNGQYLAAFSLSLQAVDRLHDFYVFEDFRNRQPSPADAWLVHGLTSALEMARRDNPEADVTAEVRDATHRLRTISTAPSEQGGTLSCTDQRSLNSPLTPQRSTFRTSSGSSRAVHQVHGANPGETWSIQAQAADRERPAAHGDRHRADRHPDRRAGRCHAPSADASNPQAGRFRLIDAPVGRRRRPSACACWRAMRRVDRRQQAHGVDGSTPSVSDGSTRCRLRPQTEP